MPQAYPRMLYSADSPATMTVPDEHAHKAAGAGWNTEPSDMHRASPMPPPVPVPSNQEAFAEHIAQTVTDRVLAGLASLLDKPPLGPEASAPPLVQSTETGEKTAFDPGPEMPSTGKRGRRGADPAPEPPESGE
jgi:hypothetical protein